MKRMLFIILLVFIAVSLWSDNILMIVAPGNFRDEEFKTPYRIFRDDSFNVVVASTTTDTVKGMLGYKLKPDILIDSVKVKDYAALVIVGGVGTLKLRGNKTLYKIIRDFRNDTTKVLSAICLSPIHLIESGVVDSMMIASFVIPDVLREAKKHNVIVKNKGVLVHERLITAAGPKWAEEFAKKIVEEIDRLKGK